MIVNSITFCDLVSPKWSHCTAKDWSIFYVINNAESNGAMHCWSCKSVFNHDILSEHIFFLKNDVYSNCYFKLKPLGRNYGQSPYYEAAVLELLLKTLSWELWYHQCVKGYAWS